MPSRLERLYFEATGIKPKDLEPKPTGPEMQATINREKGLNNSRTKLEAITHALEKKPDIDWEVAADFEGTYTVYFVPETQESGLLEGDQSRYIESMHQGGILPLHPTKATTLAEIV